MKRILLVDDDPVVLRFYREALAQRGFQVDTAADGLAALKSLRQAKPDLVVLDLMMPKFSGAEVLRFIRGHADLKALPVIVLSNAYMDPLAQDAAELGAQKGLLKIKCSPGILAAAVTDVLEGQPARETLDQLLAAPPRLPPLSASAGGGAVSQTDIPLAAPKIAPPPPPPVGPSSPNAEFKRSARHEFLNSTGAISKSLGPLLEACRGALTEQDRGLRLQDLSRKVHFLAAMAGMADCQAIAQMASALEALVFGLLDKAPAAQPSLQRTLSMAVEFLQELLEKAAESRPGAPEDALALVVDDDRLFSRLVISGLQRARVQARAAEQPERALEWLQQRHYDLILLDIEMPGMDGIELCKRVRQLPGYEKTPVIYVTLHSDFETRIKSFLSGGSDLIAKPIIPAELAVKVVMHLLKIQSPG